MLTISEESMEEEFVTMGSEVELVHGARGLVKSVQKDFNDIPGQSCVIVRVVCFTTLEVLRVYQQNLKWISTNGCRVRSFREVQRFVALHSAFKDLDKEKWFIHQDNPGVTELEAKVLQAHAAWLPTVQRDSQDANTLFDNFQQAGSELNSCLRSIRNPYSPSSPDDSD